MRWSCVGHEEQKAYLERVITANDLPHAVLLAGPEGIGKKMVADDVANALVPHGYAPDCWRLAPMRDDDSTVHDIPIELVRDMRQWLTLRPLGTHKAVLIDDADRLGGEAANTLLKVLEEPPAYAHFLLVSGKAGQILPTIASRCARLDFRPLSLQEMKEVLGKRKLDADDAQLILTVANGQPGKALALIEGKKLPIVAHHIAALEKALNAGIADRLIYAKAVADDDASADIVSWWTSYVHARLSQRPELADVAHELLDLATVVSQSQFNKRLAIEHFLLSV